MSHLEDLQKALGPDATLISDSDITLSYSRDQAPFAESATPFAVLLARNTDEVSKALAFCNQHGIPVVPRGAGSGLAGGANAGDGWLVISLEKMKAIIELDPANHIARVEPGVVNLDLDTAAKEFGLAYLPDPASRDWSTIGGNVATNAGGMCCVKYGVTSHHVRAITVVLASGEILKLGSATKKGVTGLNLLQLFIGSEGVLGIITEITVGLEVRPSPPATLIATFTTIKEAALASNALLQFRPSMLEIVDQQTIKAVQSWKPLGLEVAGSVVLMQLDEAHERCGAAVKICEDLGSIDAVYSDDPKDAADFLQVRKLAWPAMERLGAALLDDVAVPVTKIAQLVEKCEEVASKNRLTIGMYGHAGDGNMHPTIVYEHGDEDGKKRALLAFTEIIQIAQSLGGTTSGEHGIGSIKTSLAEKELGARVVDIQRSIKNILDPKNILNPNKKFAI